MVFIYGWLAFFGLVIAFVVAAVLLNRGVRGGGTFRTVAFLLCCSVGAGAVVTGLGFGPAAGWNSIALGVLAIVYSIWRVLSSRPPWDSPTAAENSPGRAGGKYENPKKPLTKAFFPIIMRQ